MSMKNSNDTIGNRTRYLLACSAVPQPTAAPRAPGVDGRIILKWIFKKWDGGMDWIDMAQDRDR
jgi:hypothetical protein